MKVIKLKWTGIRPMIMHNGRLADPTDPIAQKIADIVRKGSKKMTEEDYALRDRLEWEGGLYWTDGVGPVIISDAIERTIQFGAQKSRKGKDVKAAMICSEAEYPLKFKFNGEMTKDNLYNDGGFVIRKGVIINRNRVIRVRPMFPTGWNITFDLEYDEHVLNERTIIKANEDAGTYVGLNDWRPKYGRFIVEVL